MIRHLTARLRIYNISPRLYAWLNRPRLWRVLRWLCNKNWWLVKRIDNHVGNAICGAMSRWDDWHYFLRIAAVGGRVIIASAKPGKVYYYGKDSPTAERAYWTTLFRHAVIFGDYFQAEHHAINARKTMPRYLDGTDTEWMAILTHNATDCAFGALIASDWKAWGYLGVLHFEWTGAQSLRREFCEQ